MPYGKVLALGIAFKPLTTAFQNVVKGGGGKSGLYRVEVPKGMSLAEFNNKPGYLGSSLKENSQVGGQAVLNPVLFNPTMLFMAGALFKIDENLIKLKKFRKKNRFL